MQVTYLDELMELGAPQKENMLKIRCELGV